MPTQFQLVSEVDAMMAALMLVASLIALVALTISAVYAAAFAAMALSDKLRLPKRPSLPTVQVAQAKPSATRTVLQ